MFQRQSLPGTLLAFGAPMTAWAAPAATPSSAMRHRFSWPYSSITAAFVVPTLPSLTVSPLPSSMQSRLVLSPRSKPILIGPFQIF
jgi:hypothetical protein